MHPTQWVPWIERPGALCKRDRWAGLLETPLGLREQE